MKKLFAVLFVVAMLVLCAGCAYAEAIEAVPEGVEQPAEAIVETATQTPTASTIPTEPFTWKALGTIAGCTAFALLFVQLIKAPLDKVWKIPTRALVYVVCLILMLASACFNEGLTAESAALAIVNAVIPTLAAMGAYELTFAKA